MNSSFVDFEVNEHNVNLNVYKNRQSNYIDTDLYNKGHLTCSTV